MVKKVVIKIKILKSHGGTRKKTTIINTLDLLRTGIRMYKFHHKDAKSRASAIFSPGDTNERQDINQHFAVIL